MYPPGTICAVETAVDGTVEAGTRHRGVVRQRMYRTTVLVAVPMAWLAGEGPASVPGCVYTPLVMYKLRHIIDRVLGRRG